MRSQTGKLLLLFAASCFFTGFADAGATLDSIRQKQFINCGIHSSMPGFSILKERSWQGIEASFCRAVAAVVLGDAERVKFKPLGVAAGYTALQSGEIDLLVGHNAWTFSQDTSMGLSFVAPLYYEGQGFLVRQDSKIFVAADIKGSKVCHSEAGDIGGQLKLFSGREQVAFDTLSMGSFDAAAKAFENGLCQVLAGDLSELYVAKSRLEKEHSVQVIAEPINIRALGPLVRADDQQWFMAVRWTLYLMLAADRWDAEGKAADAKTKSLLELIGVQGISIGLDPDWPFKLLSQVGSYESVFRRHLGNESPYKMPRGLNRLAEEGGLHLVPALD